MSRTDARVAEPNPATLERLRVEPMAPVFVRRHAASSEAVEATAERGLVALAGIAVGLFLVLGSLFLVAVALGAGGLFFVTLCVAAMGAVLFAKGDRAPAVIPVPCDSAPTLVLATTPGRPACRVGSPAAAEQAALALAPRSGGAPFDPTLPRHRALAALVHDCRVRDGLGLTDDGDALRGSVVCLDGRYRSIEDRAAEWWRIAEFLDARDDPRTAWLAAVACGERSSVTRGARALSMLPEGRVAAVVAAIEAGGAWAARGALALHRGAVGELDALITHPDAVADELGTLMAARWQRAPEPSALGAWLVGPAQASALSRAPLRGAGEARWRALLDHPTLAIVAIGAEAMMAGHGDEAKVGARTLLSRADGESEAIEAPLRAAIELLAEVGEGADLRLLGRWRDHPTLGRAARDGQARLRRWVDVEPHHGRLAVTGEALSGALSPARGAGPGALSATEGDEAV